MTCLRPIKVSYRDNLPSALQAAVIRVNSVSAHFPYIVVNH